MKKKDKKLMDEMSFAMQKAMEGISYWHYADIQRTRHKKTVSFEAWVLLKNALTMEEFLRDNPNLKGVG